MNFTVEKRSATEAVVVLTDCLEGVPETGYPFSLRQWKQLLEKMPKQPSDNVRGRTGKKWHKYPSFTIYVSDRPIDHGLVYRHIAPGYEVYSKVGIYQRELFSFRTRAIYENTLLPQTCVNCHSFKQGDPEYLTLHVRGEKGATVLQKKERFVTWTAAATLLRQPFLILPGILGDVSLPIRSIVPTSPST